MALGKHLALREGGAQGSLLVSNLELARLIWCSGVPLQWIGLYVFFCNSLFWHKAIKIEPKGFHPISSVFGIINLVGELFII